MQSGNYDRWGKTVQDIVVKMGSCGGRHDESIAMIIVLLRMGLDGVTIFDHD
jgi:hypothetical protein